MPKGLKAIGIIFMFLSIFPLVLGLALLIPGTLSKQIIDFLDSIKHQNFAFGWPFGILLIVVGLITLISSLGFLKGKKWAWWAMIILFAINGLSQLADMPKGLFGLLIAALLIYYLTRKNIRESFE